MSVYVGIDVHRKRSQVAVVDQAGQVLANRNVVHEVDTILPVIGQYPIHAAVVTLRHAYAKARTSANGHRVLRAALGRGGPRSWPAAPASMSARGRDARASVEVHRPWSGPWRASRGPSRPGVDHGRRPPRWHHHCRASGLHQPLGGGGGPAATASHEGADHSAHAADCDRMRCKRGTWRSCWAAM